MATENSNQAAETQAAENTERTPGVAESLGTAIGQGACTVLSKLRDKSREFKDYYAGKDKKDRTLVEKIGNAANTVVRAGANTVRGVGRFVGGIVGSDEFKDLTKSASAKYDDIRSKYKELLKNSEKDVDSRKRSGEYGFKLGFKSFMTAVLSTVDKVYGVGEKVVKSAARGLISVKDGIKGSDAYKKLVNDIHEQEKIDKEKAAEKEKLADQDEDESRPEERDEAPAPA